MPDRRRAGLRASGDNAEESCCSALQPASPATTSNAIVSATSAPAQGVQRLCNSSRSSSDNTPPSWNRLRRRAGSDGRRATRHLPGAGVERRGALERAALVAVGGSILTQARPSAWRRRGRRSSSGSPRSGSGPAPPEGEARDRSRAGHRDAHAAGAARGHPGSDQPRPIARVWIGIVGEHVDGDSLARPCPGPVVGRDRRPVGRQGPYHADQDGSVGWIVPSIAGAIENADRAALAPGERGERRPRLVAHPRSLDSSRRPGVPGGSSADSSRGSRSASETSEPRSISIACPAWVALSADRATGGWLIGVAHQTAAPPAIMTMTTKPAATMTAT